MLWDYQYPGAMFNYLEKWVEQLKWQRLVPFEKLAEMLLKALPGTHPLPSALRHRHQTAAALPRSAHTHSGCCCCCDSPRADFCPRL
jgi:hypothetical protein